MALDINFWHRCRCHCRRHSQSFRHLFTMLILLQAWDIGKIFDITTIATETQSKRAYFSGSIYWKWRTLGMFNSPPLHQNTNSEWACSVFTKAVWYSWWHCQPGLFDHQQWNSIFSNTFRFCVFSFTLFCVIPFDSFLFSSFFCSARVAWKRCEIFMICITLRETRWTHD